MAAQFSPASSKQIDELLPKYPTTMAACLPVLWIAQEQFGWISREVMELVAGRLDLPLSHVYGVVTFYTLFNQQPRGTFHVQVCTNVACMLLDAYEVLRQFEQELGLRCGETTPDKLFTLSEVECLAACGSGPCVQINDEYREPVRPEDVANLVAELRRGALQAANSPADATDPAQVRPTGLAGPAGPSGDGRLVSEANPEPLEPEAVDKNAHGARHLSDENLAPERVSFGSASPPDVGEAS